jgi:hypothetical protein
MLQEGINALLASDPGIQALVGTPLSRPDGTTGVFPVTLPQGAPLPAIAYLRIAGHEIDTLDGRGELRVSRIQISCFGQTYADVAKTAEAAKDALVGFHGILEEGTEVDYVTMVLENDAYEPVPKIFHSPFDVEVWYRNAGQ